MAAVAEVRGDRARSDVLFHAAQQVAALSTASRRDLARAAKAGEPLDGDWAVPVANVLSPLAAHGVPAVVGGEIARLPADLAALLRLPDIDPADVLRAHRRHGVVTAADIAAEAAFDEARDHTGGGDTPLMRLAQWIPSVRGERARLPLGRAVAILDAVTDALDEPERYGRALPLGSIRRFEPTVGDIDVLLVHPDPATALTSAIECLQPEDVRHRSAHRAVVHVKREEVGLRACHPAEAAFVSLWRTGSAAHVRQLRRRATGRGLDLRPDALRGAGGAPVPCASEDEVFAALGLASDRARTPARRGRSRTGGPRGSSGTRRRGGRQG